MPPRLPEHSPPVSPQAARGRRNGPVVYWRAATLIFMALIFALSAWPGASSSGTYTFFGDFNAIARTAAHVGVFGILAGLCKQAFTPASGPYSGSRWGLAFLVAALYWSFGRGTSALRAGAVRSLAGRALRHCRGSDRPGSHVVLRPSIGTRHARPSRTTRCAGRSDRRRSRFR